MLRDAQRFLSLALWGDDVSVPQPFSSNSKVRQTTYVPNGKSSAITKYAPASDRGGTLQSLEIVGTPLA